MEKADEKIMYNGRNNTRLYVDGYDIGYYIDENSDSPFMIYLGRYPTGSVVHIEAFSNVEHGTIHVDSLNEKAYSQVIDVLDDDQLNILEHSSGHFRGKINAEKSGSMLLSLPYMKGWSIKVDGVQTQYDSYRNALITIPLSAGEHDIRISYVSPGFYLGLIVCMISWIVCILMICGRNRRRME